MKTITITRDITITAGDIDLEDFEASELIDALERQRTMLTHENKERLLRLLESCGLTSEGIDTALWHARGGRKDEARICIARTLPRELAGLVAP
jgi:aromatic ring hydroxylase